MSDVTDAEMSTMTLPQVFVDLVDLKHEFGLRFACTECGAEVGEKCHSVRFPERQARNHGPRTAVLDRLFSLGWLGATVWERQKLLEAEAAAQVRAS